MRYPFVLLAFGFLPNTTIGEEHLGRLFFTPQQRERLDEQRRLDAVSPLTTAETHFTVNGEIREKDGKGTIWINGEASPGEKKRKPVPVGDTFFPDTGKKQSLLGNGKIIVHSQPGQP